MYRWTTLLLLAAGAAHADPIVLDSAAKVSALCNSIQVQERLKFKSGPVSVADQRAKYEEQRKAALEQTYVMSLKSGEFKIDESDASPGAVSVDTTRPFRGVDGKLTIYDIEVDELTLHADEGKASALQDAIAAGRARLVITFKVAADEESPCFATTAKAYILATDFVSAELRDGATVLARASEDDGFAPPVNTTGKPTVDIVPMSGEGGEPAPADFVEKLAKTRPQAQKCYEVALAKDPTLSGRIVFSWVPKAGKTVPAVQADTVENDDVVDCLTKAMTAVNGSTQKRPTVAIHLARQ